MSYTKIMLVIFLFKFLHNAFAAQLDPLNCGTDDSPDVFVGNVSITDYPWLGVLYYTTHDLSGENRAVTTVCLIQQEFVIAPAAEIGPMPKNNFRSVARVLLGQNWNARGRRVRNYVIHPEYGETMNTVALVHLREPVRNIITNIIPLCPPPEILRDPEFYVMKFNDNYNDLQKRVIPVTHVPGKMCKDFYMSANLYAKKMRPPHVACVVSLEDDKVCVWEAGSALVVRDVWGRWQFLGLGVRGPGCGAPARFLDMLSYYPWIESSLDKFRRMTISKITDHKYVIRSGSEARTLTRYGSCDYEEKVNLIYRDGLYLRTSNYDFQYFNYNMTLYESVEYTCLTIELINASARTDLVIKHTCTRFSYGPACYAYRGSVFDLSIYVMFADTCLFEMAIWGWTKNMTLLDIQEWKWEEGTFYDDFTLERVEYHGPPDQTEFGFEPLDEKIWVPEYDLWTTTPFDNSSWSSTTPRPTKGDGWEAEAGYNREGGTKGPTEHPGTSDTDSEFALGIQWT